MHAYIHAEAQAKYIQAYIINQAHNLSNTHTSRQHIKHTMLAYAHTGTLDTCIHTTQTTRQAGRVPYHHTQSCIHGATCKHNPVINHPNNPTCTQGDTSIPHICIQSETHAAQESYMMAYLLTNTNIRKAGREKPTHT